jgi:hypothetical protein
VSLIVVTCLNSTTFDFVFGDALDISRKTRRGALWGPLSE